MTSPDINPSPQRSVSPDIIHDSQAEQGEPRVPEHALRAGNNLPDLMEDRTIIVTDDYEGPDRREEHVAEPAQVSRRRRASDALKGLSDLLLGPDYR